MILQLFQETGFYVTCNGRISQDQEDVAEGQVYHCVPRLLAGKGGNCDMATEVYTKAKFRTFALWRF